jgi:sulfur-oxidizing protein SoxY
MTQIKLKMISRRNTLYFLGVAPAALMFSKYAFAKPNLALQKIKELTKNNAVEEIDLFLDLPEIAENGNQVKVSFDIDSPMTQDDFVKTVYILADGNPAPNVAKFSFSTDMGACSATTRMRLSKTQNIYLLAEYNNGNFAMTKSKVKVTIGGCGG